MTKYLVPSKSNGKRMPSSSFKFDPDFQEALRIFAAQETQDEGRKISQAVALMTLALKGSPKLRQIFKRLKQERRHAIKKQEERIRKALKHI